MDLHGNSCEEKITPQAEKKKKLHPHVNFCQKTTFNIVKRVNFCTCGLNLSRVK